MTVTVHYHDSDWSLHDFVLETTAFPDRHTGINISSKLVEVAEWWGIVNKIVAIVHDQASNIELSMNILEDEHGWTSCSLQCMAHCLQLCLNAGFSIPQIERLISASNKLVSHFHHSCVATTALKDRQEQMNISTQSKKLITSCATRWNSLYMMFDRLLKLHWPITAVLSDASVTNRSDRFLDLKSKQWTLASRRLSKGPRTIFCCHHLL